MPEMHLKQTEFTYSACGPFTKNKARIQKLKEAGDAKYIYRNELDKAYFQHDMAYGDFANLARRTASNKVLRDKAFNIAKNPKYDGCQRGFASMVYTFFNKKSTSLTDKSAKGGSVNNKIKQNQQLAEEFHKTIFKEFKRRRVYLSFKDNIWGAHLADM